MSQPLFANRGVHAVVDGQFGSTGKGVLAAWLAEQAHNQGVRFDVVVSNAGPNSGHTFYDKAGNKHILKQLPTFAVASFVNGWGSPVVYLSAGAIVDLDVLFAEASRYPGLRIFVDPMAAVITPEDRHAEKDGTIAAVAGTRSGTGAALARKVLRDPTATMRGWLESKVNGVVFPGKIHVIHQDLFHPDTLIFLEVSQGFSLGLNSEFFPKVTSRECTVQQGLADARIPAQHLSRVYVSMRTYPIRVGNVDGFSSGDCYGDQEETTWEAIGQTPELTTVTQRVRRVFTFSEQQAYESVNVNGADFVFLNFMNYLDEKSQTDLLAVLSDIRDGSSKLFDVIQCFGPTSEDVRW